MRYKKRYKMRYKSAIIWPVQSYLFSSMLSSKMCAYYKYIEKVSTITMGLKLG